MTDKTELRACPSGHNKKAVFKRCDDDHNDHQDVIYCSEINCVWQVSRWNSLGSEKEAKKELTKLWNTRHPSAEDVLEQAEKRGAVKALEEVQNKYKDLVADEFGNFLVGGLRMGKTTVQKFKKRVAEIIDTQLTKLKENSK